MCSAGLMEGCEGVAPGASTDSYSKGMVAAAAADPATLQRENILRHAVSPPHPYMDPSALPVSSESPSVIGSRFVSRQVIPTRKLNTGATMPALAFGTGTAWFEGEPKPAGAASALGDSLAAALQVPPHPPHHRTQRVRAHHHHHHPRHH